MKKIFMAALWCLSSLSVFAATSMTTPVHGGFQGKRGTSNVGEPQTTESLCWQVNRADAQSRGITSAVNYSCVGTSRAAITFSQDVVCPAAPVTTQTQACPTGTTGTWTQTRTVTAGTNPATPAACWVTGAWTPTTPPAGSCPPVAPVDTWTRLASENGSFSVPTNTTVRYGVGTSYRYKIVSGSGQCTTAFFDGIDPAWGEGKFCDSYTGTGTPPAPSNPGTPTTPPPTDPGTPTTPPPTGAVTYYLSDCQEGAAAGCVAGNNSNPGTETSPKQNLSGINVNILPAGSRILFKRGGAWSNVRQVLENMNTSATNPLVFDAYGTGPAPLLKTATENMFILGGNWNNTSNDGGYVIRNLKLDGMGTATWGIWFLNTVRDVTVENTEITGFGIAINSNDSATHGVTGIVLRNNTITRNRAMGMLGHYNNILIEGNTFSFNATGSTFDHGSYIGGGNNITLRNNRYIRNSTVGGTCQGGNMTFHGQIDGLLVEGNVIEQDSATAGCWLMSVTQGYSTAEWFRNAIIRNNKLINGGNTAMAVQSAPGVIIEGNVAINTNGTSQTAFSIGSGPGPYADGDVPDANAVVRNNTYCRANASATGNVVSINSPGGSSTNNVVLSGTDATTGVCAFTRTP